MPLTTMGWTRPSPTQTQKKKKMEEYVGPPVSPP